MPYIKQEHRGKIDMLVDTVIQGLVAAMGKMMADRFPDDGVVNYLFTRILLRLYGTSYKGIIRVIGLLETIKLEYYRRQAAPYEDEKRNENGEVYY